MVALDVRTLIYSYLITCIVCLIVILQLWIQNRERFAGTTWWLVNFIFQTVSLLLMGLRGTIPDWASIILANDLIVVGVFFGLIGFEKFLVQKSSYVFNCFIILVFTATHIWFTYYNPNLSYRILNISMVLIIFCFQYIWLLLFRISHEYRKLTLGVAVIFSLYAFVNLFRIINCFVTKGFPSDYFQFNKIETLIIMIDEILFILLIYNIAILLNKKLLNEIARDEEKFSKAFHSSPYAIVITNYKNQQIIEVNKGFSDITGYPNIEAIGQTTSTLNLWKSNSHKESIVAEFIEKGKIYEKEIQFRKKSGEIRTALFSTEIITVKNEKCTFSTINDITEKKHSEMVLRDSELQLSQLNDTKDKFISIIAHDLKSPFNSILGFSELLIDNNDFDVEKTQKLIQHINTSAKQTLSLLDNLLVWAHSQTGKIEFKPENLNLASLIQEMIKDFPENHKNISINYIYCEEITIFADENMVKTILRNLISNAIKFTKSNGNIDVYTIINESEIEILVKDDGIGIDEETKNKLFKIDSNISNTGTANEKGTGLGLILCHEFVTRHGGRIWVESELNKGSLFYFTIPNAS